MALECNRDEALKAKALAEEKFLKNDINGAKKLALKAQSMLPGLDGIEQLLDTLNIHVTAAEAKVGMEKDWYAILSLDASSSDADLKRRYRKLALAFHPDKNHSVGAEGAFKLVNEAWNVLSDETKREEFDRKRQLLNGSDQRKSARSAGSTAFTDWVRCGKCKIEYEYLKIFIDENLQCPNCGTPLRSARSGHKKNDAATVPFTQVSGQQQLQKPTEEARVTSQVSEAEPAAGGNVTDCYGRVPGLGVPQFQEVKTEVEESTEEGTEEHLSEGDELPMEGSTADGSSSSLLHEKNRYSSRDDIENVVVSNARLEANRVLKEPLMANPSGARETRAQASSPVNHQSCPVLEEVKVENAEPGEKLNASTGTSSSDGAATELPSSGAKEQAAGAKKRAVEETPVCHLDKPEELLCMDVPDADFYDFDKERPPESFHAGDIWAVYDDEDGMPRFYVILRRVLSSNPLTVEMAFLTSRSTAEFRTRRKWVSEGFAKSCGLFQLRPYELRVDCFPLFSHRASWKKVTKRRRTGANRFFCILPRTGEVWALYRNWEPSWNRYTPNHVVHSYDVVEVVGVQYERGEHGVLVVPLVKMDGYISVFARCDELMGAERAVVAGEEMLRFSHRVPAMMLTGEEGEGAPRGCWQLDPAALPPSLLKSVDGSQEPMLKKQKMTSAEQEEEGCQPAAEAAGVPEPSAKTPVPQELADDPSTHKLMADCPAPCDASSPDSVIGVPDDCAVDEPATDALDDASFDELAADDGLEAKKQLMTSAEENEGRIEPAADSVGTLDTSADSPVHDELAQYCSYEPTIDSAIDVSEDPVIHEQATDGPIVDDEPAANEDAVVQELDTGDRGPVSGDPCLDLEQATEVQEPFLDEPAVNDESATVNGESEPSGFTIEEMATKDPVNLYPSANVPEQAANHPGVYSPAVQPEDVPAAAGDSGMHELAPGDPISGHPTDDDNDLSKAAFEDTPVSMPCRGRKRPFALRVCSSQRRNIPDPDFHCFNKDRSPTCLRPGQVWAVYDAADGMPRLYVRLREILSSDPLSVSMALLTSRTTAEFGTGVKGVGQGFTLSCGSFLADRYEIHSDDLPMFSHTVSWSWLTEIGPGDQQCTYIHIHPCVGDLWALYRDWAPTWDRHTQEDVVRRYELVEVVRQECGDEEGCRVVVVPMVKVEGYTAVFRSCGEVEGAPRVLAGEEMRRLSHQVPARFLTGEEGEGAPAGVWQLDPAAVPPHILCEDGCQETQAEKQQEDEDDEGHFHDDSSLNKPAPDCPVRNRAGDDTLLMDLAVECNAPELPVAGECDPIVDEVTMADDLAVDNDCDLAVKDSAHDELATDGVLPFDKQSASDASIGEPAAGGNASLNEPAASQDLTPDGPVNPTAGHIKQLLDRCPKEDLAALLLSSFSMENLASFFLDVARTDPDVLGRITTMAAGARPTRDKSSSTTVQHPAIQSSDVKATEPAHNRPHAGSAPRGRRRAAAPSTLRRNHVLAADAAARLNRFLVRAYGRDQRGVP